MKRLLILAAVAGLIAYAQLSAQSEGVVKHKGDEPPHGSRLRIGTTKLRETEPMKGIEFLPDGKHLITTNGPLVHCWNLESGLMVNAHKFTPPVDKKKPFGTGGVASFKVFRTNALSEDGKQLAVLVKNQIFVTSIDVMKTPEYVLLPERAFAKAVYLAIAYATLGQEDVVAALDDTGVVHLLSKTKAGLRVDSGIANARNFAVAGARCVVANDQGFASILNLETRKRLSGLSESSIEAVALSPDGKILAAHCNENEIVLRDLDSNKELGRRTMESKSKVASIAISKDRMIIYRGATVEIRDRKSDKIIATERVEGTSRTRPVFSRDEKRCAVGGEGAIHIWNAETGAKLTPAGHFGAVTTLHWGSSLWSASRDASARRWDLKSGKELERFDAVRFGVHAWAFTKDDGSIYWLQSNGLDVHLRNLAKRDERIVFSSTAQKSFGTYLSSITLSQDEKTLAVAESSNGVNISLHTLESKKTATWKVEREKDDLWPIDDLLFVSEDVLLSRSLQGRVRVWNLKDRTEVRKFQVGNLRPSVRSHGFIRMLLTPDRKFLVGADYLDDGKFPRKSAPVIAFWEIETGKRVKHFTIESPPTTLAMTTDGKTIVAGDEQGGVEVWDIASTNRIFHEPAAHRGAVTSVAIAPDGQAFATGSADTSILLWDMPKSRRPK